DFFTYLTSDPANDWGIELTTVGYYHAAPRTKYPPPGHPKTHAFDWKTGRRLDEYQLIYVPTGIGCFENRHQRSEVSAGDLILLYKNDWHRYRPQYSNGWETYWVGFKGPYIEKYVHDRLFTQRESSLRSVGDRSALALSFDQLIALSKRDEPVFKTVALGCFLQIVAHAATYDEKTIASRRASTISEKAVDAIRQRLFTDVDFHQMAASFGLSYSRFRSLFKGDTGFAPHQFLLNERIACAKRLLKDPTIEVKTVSHRAGFHSPGYFSKLFRRKTGLTPSAARAVAYRAAV